jgi:hypothetical protein
MSKNHCNAGGDGAGMESAAGKRGITSPKYVEVRRHIVGKAKFKRQIRQSITQIRSMNTKIQSTKEVSRAELNQLFGYAINYAVSAMREKGYIKARLFERTETRFLALDAGNEADDNYGEEFIKIGRLWCEAHNIKAVVFTSSDMLAEVSASAALPNIGSYLVKSTQELLALDGELSGYEEHNQFSIVRADDGLFLKFTEFEIPQECFFKRRSFRFLPARPPNAAEQANAMVSLQRYAVAFRHN